MMAVSKAITSGYGPLAALVMDREYGSLLPSSTVRKTNGADMRSLAAAKAVIERLRGIEKRLIPEDIDADLKEELEQGLLATFSTKEESLKYKLVSMKDEFPLFGDLRGSGLIWSLDVVDIQGKLDHEACAIIQKALLERGVLVRDVRGALLFKVPITFTDDDLQQGFKIIEEYLRSR
ncbi:4-aminobutyrate aminotransferase-like protein [candidate division TM7 genomosp. GTL1]|nr:4-aminobutyrate aminotransferase-like protein [candidate division TM7 genomosp. GTL1]